MTTKLSELLDTPLRKTYRTGRSSKFGFDPDEAIRAWRSGAYPSIQALADKLGVDRSRLSRLLHLRKVLPTSRDRAP